jgi:hypothetical protein
MSRRVVVGAFVGVAAAVVGSTVARQSWTRQQAARAEQQPDVGFMLALHAALLRDVERLRRAAGTPRLSAEVREGWELFRRELEVHHRAEDDDLWPRLRSRLTDPTDLATVDAMYQEHRQLPGLLERVADALGTRESSQAVEDLAGVLLHHLGHEERDALPLVPIHLSGQEWHDFLMLERSKRPPRERPEFLTWVLDDAPRRHAEAVLRELPLPGRVAYRVVLRRVYDRRGLWTS